MLPQTLNLDTRQGRDFALDMIIYEDKDIGTLFDLTGYTFEAEIRVSQDRSSTLLATITVTVTIIDSKLNFALTASETQDIPIGDAYWDLLVTKSGYCESWFEGTVTSTGGATQV